MIFVILLTILQTHGVLINVDYRNNHRSLEHSRTHGCKISSGESTSETDSDDYGACVHQTIRSYRSIPCRNVYRIHPIQGKSFTVYILTWSE